MSKPGWYYHRLRAMSADEMARHARKKWRQFIDARRKQDWSGVVIEATGKFPSLPRPQAAPAAVRDALTRDIEAILAGRWKAFGHLPLQVDDPPRWHKDYLAGCDLASSRSSFKLNHRELPAGTDIKLIWESSRWYQLTRLAMGAYVLGDARAGRKCVEWLEDWVKHNPPFTGWNWTSALEVGMRLIQFTWIHALLKPGADADLSSRLNHLGSEILPPHVSYCWRHQSFGSSANNHLLGELTGLIVACSRWPTLAQGCVSLSELQLLWECEVLAQFAPDGGNREQALNYQLFSWEFAWQGWLALRAADEPVDGAVTERLYAAGSFFTNVQVEREAWDYGDSDSAFVLPGFLLEENVTREWREWMIDAKSSPGIDFWHAEDRADFFRELASTGAGSTAGNFHSTSHAKRLAVSADRPGFLFYPDSGQAINRAGRWTLRWDLSPLGYLRTAAHGHLDALHLSLWLDGRAFVIDPGTGAYYADKRLRAWLASRNAHNGPCPAGAEWPKRLGPFLWAEHHKPPQLVSRNEAGGVRAVFEMPGVSFERAVILSPDETRCEVEDRICAGTAEEFSVRWQFAPGTQLERIAERHFQVTREGISLQIEIGVDWAEVFFQSEKTAAKMDASESSAPEAGFSGTVSSSFRRVEWGPFIKLAARPKGDKPCVFRTTFLASPRP